MARPIAKALTRDHEVWGTARFGDERVRDELTAAGVRCVTADLASLDLAAVPRDVDHVLHFAVAKTNEWPRDLDANGLAAAKLLEHCRGATSFLHVSSNAVYQPSREPFREDSALGDNHRVVRGMDTYSITKIAGEAFARYGSLQFGVPVTIARLNVPYGDHGGWPAYHLDRLRNGKAIAVRTDGPSPFNPIHIDDMVEMIPKLLDVASVGATTVNWGGDQVVTIEEWSAYMAELLGVEPVFAPSATTFYSVELDLTRMHELVGHTRVDWRDGFARMVAALS